MYFTHTSHNIAKPYTLGMQAQPAMDSIVKSPIKELSQGDQISSPSGRHLLVDDVFVPRHNKEKSLNLPARFRGLNRKVVIFRNGAIAPLKEVQANYQVLMTQ
ncbi:MAG: hypothetical protein K6L81_03575 [Agarilytica sp.]